MRRRPGVWIVGLLVAVIGATAWGVQASAARHASTTDSTYSCGVRRQHFIILSGSVTLPPAQGRSQPGLLTLITVDKSVQKNGATITKAQLGLSAKKAVLKVDTSTCRPVKHRIPLKPKGLSPFETVTPTFKGHISQRCGTTKGSRVLVRIRLTTPATGPPDALIAIRNDDAKH